MTKFSSEIQRMTDHAFNAFSDKAIYNGAHAVDVILDRDVERVSTYGESSVNKFEITVNTKQVQRMTKGDTFDLGSERYTIASIIDGDETLTIGSAGRNSA